jgi:hypothetical protein
MDRRRPACIMDRGRLARTDVLESKNESYDRRPRC